MRRLLFLAIFGLTGTATLLGLGTWQMKRLAWKQTLLAEIEERIADAPVALPSAPDPEQDRYLPVTASGTIEPGALHVLASIKQVGPGLRIITPFETGGRRILLDRGFLREEDKGRTLSTGPADIDGNLDWPRETDRFTPAPDADANLWFARDVPAMAAALQAEPILLVARSQTDPALTPLPVDTAGIPNDHLQYAITWFSLAAIWAAMTGYFLWRSRAGAQGPT